MDLTFSDFQLGVADEFATVLRDKAPRDSLHMLTSLSQYIDNERWTQLAALGWLSAAIPEEYGGSALEAKTLCLLARAAGTSLTATPFTMSACVFVSALQLLPCSGHLIALYDQLMSGAAIGTLITPDDWRLSPTVSQEKIVGHTGWISEGAASTHALAYLPDIGIVLLTLPTDRKVQTVRALDRLHLAAEFHLDSADCVLLLNGDSAESIWQRIIYRASVFTAFEQLGAAESALKAATGHCSQRVAFGRIIGSFQAIKHLLADMLIAVEVARANCYFAAASIETGANTPVEAIACARISATESLALCARNNIQLHGAIGTTLEADCQLYLRRSQALSVQFGNTLAWKRDLIDSQLKRQVTEAQVKLGSEEINDGYGLVTFRSQTRQWIEQNAPWSRLDEVRGLAFAGRPTSIEHDLLPLAKDYMKKRAADQWSCLQWPQLYGGRGLTPMENAIWQEEEGAFSTLAEPFMISQCFVAPTLMAFANEEVKKSRLPKIASGEEIWCQMFSEPAAGSDLAAVRTKAIEVEDGWLVNGQKVWTSGAHYSDWGMALVRTNPDVPKHRGLTMLFFRMNAPGVVIRPIKLMSGQAEFNEVFLDDVFVPKSQQLGATNDGWKVALTTLSNERMAIGTSIPTGFEEAFSIALMPRGTTKHRLIDQDYIRLRLADWYVKASAIKHSNSLMLTALKNGANPGPEAAIGKLVSATVLQQIAMESLEWLGTDSHDGGEADLAVWKLHTMLEFSVTHRIQGGTDEIIRNILAERVLGLPSEARPDRDLPFKDIPTS